MAQSLIRAKPDLLDPDPGGTGPSGSGSGRNRTFWILIRAEPDLLDPDTGGTGPSGSGSDAALSVFGNFHAKHLQFLMQCAYSMMPVL